MRKSAILLLYAAVNVVALGIIFVHSVYHQAADRTALKGISSVVKRLELTDLSLFTEARYTRHPSQTDLYTPFQDHPMSLEHFPSGTFVEPPGRNRSFPQ